MQPTTFADLGLSPKVQAAVEASGYTTPTPIQQQAIPVAVTGRDVLGIAQTGTGKTAAFVMPMITRLETGRARARMPRSLILAPTRELAAQVAQSFEKYGTNHSLNLALLIGGVSMEDQIRKVDRGVDVLIATPGRLLDLFGRGKVMLMGVEILVIDEADRMLDMGFIPDIEKICKLLPPRRQTLFFSATMPPEITRLVATFLNDPVRVEVAKPATTAKTITQRFQFCANGEDWSKREMLRDLIRAENVKNAIIFCNRKRDVAILLKSLQKHGFNAGALHGDMDQSSRMATLDKFRSGELQFLAASDVAARGLDIPDVSHVFNFDVPWQGDDYVHRIGRTGRAGREGFSATLVTMDDIKALNEIAKITGEEPVWIGEAPSEEDLAEGARRKRGRGRGRSAPSGRDGRRDEGRRDGRRSEGRRDERGGERRGPRPDRPERRDDRPAAVIDQPLAAEAAEGDQGLDIDLVSETTPLAVEAVEAREQGDRPRRRRRGGRGGRDRDDRPHDGASGEAAAEAAPEAEREPRRIADDLPGSGDQPSAVASSEPRRDRDRPRREDRPRRDDREQGHRRDAQPRDDRPREDRPRQERQARDDRPQRDEQPRHRDRNDRQDNRDRNEQPRERNAERQQPRAERQDYDLSPQGRPVRDRSRNRDRQDNGPRVGFQDNIPAFLRKPVRA